MHHLPSLMHARSAILNYSLNFLPFLIFQLYIITFKLRVRILYTDTCIFDNIKQPSSIVIYTYPKLTHPASFWQNLTLPFKLPNSPTHGSYHSTISVVRTHHHMKHTLPPPPLLFKIYSSTAYNINFVSHQTYFHKKHLQLTSFTLHSTASHTMHAWALWFPGKRKNRGRGSFNLYWDEMGPQSSLTELMTLQNVGSPHPFVPLLIIELYIDFPTPNFS